MPAWMGSVAEWLPMTHGIAAAREVASGADWAQVAGLVRTELAIGVLYVAVGLALLAVFERESRARATLDLA